MKFIFPRYSWIIGLLSFGIAALLTLGWYRSSVTEMKILLIPNDVKSGVLATQVVETLSEDIRTVAFYERIVRQYPGKSSAWDQMTLSEKHAWWEKQVTTERVKNSGIVSVILTGNTANQADLADQIVEVLRTEPKRLYGDTSTVGVVVLEQPYSETRLVEPAAWVIASLSLGFLGMFVALFLLQAVRSVIFRLTVSVQNPVLNSSPTPVNFSNITVPERAEQPVENDPLDTAFSIPASHSDPFLAVKKHETISSSPETTPLEVTHGAPGNLPFIDGDAFSWEKALPGLKVVHELSRENMTEESNQETVSVQQSQTEGVVSAEPALPAEPTEEELKRRLNQLLRGEM